MSETRFTEGDWVIYPLEDDKEYIRIRGSVLGGRFKIANVISLTKHHDGMAWCQREVEETIANAHLIAAAPEMYAMLEEIVIDAKSYESRSGKLPSWAARADKLLAKARGEIL